ncbi:hypothetical protein LEP3755_26310 [Leptolyngbya sp. NIES-3755]|nr:hypothetical protein LEP3755_26310 [Leptolyngbya sp. NIES-3755]
MEQAPYYEKGLKRVRFTYLPQNCKQSGSLDFSNCSILTQILLRAVLRRANLIQSAPSLDRTNHQ